MQLWSWMVRAESRRTAVRHGIRRNRRKLTFAVIGEIGMQTRNCRNSTEQFERHQMMRREGVQDRTIHYAMEAVVRVL